jgi:hypothetical protein
VVNSTYVLLERESLQTLWLASDGKRCSSVNSINNDLINEKCHTIMYPKACHFGCYVQLFKLIWSQLEAPFFYFLFQFCVLYCIHAHGSNVVSINRLVLFSNDHLLLLVLALAIATAGHSLQDIRLPDFSRSRGGRRGGRVGARGVLDDCARLKLAQPICSFGLQVVRGSKIGMPTFCVIDYCTWTLACSMGVHPNNSPVTPSACFDLLDGWV